MRDLLNYIVIDPSRRARKPCIRGTRIPVYDVLESLASGMSTEERTPRRRTGRSAQNGECQANARRHDSHFAHHDVRVAADGRAGTDERRVAAGPSALVTAPHNEPTEAAALRALGVLSSHLRYLEVRCSHIAQRSVPS